ncbi:MAG: TonB family protein [Candidatus Edwardsbacteria bacterium]|nr:TonB family protein [Candidatus Edwardsbacteria bacterium]
MTRRFLAALLTISLALLAVSGCSRTEKYPPRDMGATLTVGMLSEPSFLNPFKLSFTASTAIQEKMLLRLHRFDQSMNIVPELAVSWKFSEDFKEVTYTLREGVKWSDGRPVTAEDVKFTYDLMYESRLSYARIGALQFVEKVEVVGPYAVRFKFIRVYSDELFDTGIFVLPKHVLEQQNGLAEFEAGPVTDGPFKFVEWVRGDRLTLAANPDFYKGMPAFDQITFKFFPGEAELMAAIKRGEVDFTEELSPQSIAQLQDDPSLKFIDNPGRSCTYIGWNIKSGAFADPKMRKALAMAVDPIDLIDKVLMGKGKLVSGPFLPTSWAYDQNLKPLPADPAQAQALLAELGWKERNRDGFLTKGRTVLQFDLLLVQGQAVQEAAARLIQQQLKEIGVKVNLVSLDPPQFLVRVRQQGRYDAILLSWMNDFKVDPTAVWHSDVNKGKFNLMGYANPAVDSLIDQGLGTLSRRKAKDLWVKFQQFIAAELPTTYLFVPDVSTVIYKGLKGPQVDPRGAIAALDEWSIPQSERRGVQVAAATPTTSAAPEPATPTERPAPEPRPEPIKPTPAAKPAAAAPVKPSTDDLQNLLAAETKPPTPASAPVAATPEPTAVEEIPPTEPEVIKMPPAAYPEMARKAGVTGRVFVKVVVAADGSLKSAEVLRGIGGGCDEAAMEAAQKATFKPGTVNGKPAERGMTIPFTFR